MQHFGGPSKGNRCVHGNKPQRDLTVSVDSIPSDVHPAKAGCSVPVRDSEIISNADEVESIEADTADEVSNLDSVQPLEVDTTVLRSSASDDKAKISVCDCKLSRENYKLVEIVAKLDYIIRCRIHFKGRGRAN